MNITTLMPSLAVKDFDASLSWYTTLFGRGPDRVPMEGTAEWDLAHGAGVQVSTSTETPRATVIIGVDDVDQTVRALAAGGIAGGDPFTVPSGQFRLSLFEDPAGNTLVLSHVLAEGPEQRPA
jgi:predicted enzyme related to lactoylglutathione lyase